jgi:hypothetical protein
MTIDAICTCLQQRYSINVARRTLQRRLQTWEVRLQPDHINDTQLIARVRWLVVKKCLKDKKVLTHLSAEGISISMYTLRNIRRKLRLRLRTDCPEERARQNTQIITILI